MIMMQLVDNESMVNYTVHSGCTGKIGVGGGCRGTGSGASSSGGRGAAPEPLSDSAGAGAVAPGAVEEEQSLAVMEYLGQCIRNSNSSGDGLSNTVGVEVGPGAPFYNPLIAVSDSLNIAVSESDARGV